MIQIEQQYSELINFLKLAPVEEKVFIFDMEKPKRVKSIVSYNGIYDLETIKTIISYLFKKGNDNLWDKLQPLLKEKKLKEFGDEIGLHLDTLKEVIGSIGFNKAKVVTVTEVEIRSSLEKVNAEIIFRQFEKASNMLELSDVYDDHWKMEIKRAVEYLHYLLLGHTDKLIKKSFSLTPDFCENHTGNLYGKLNPKYLLCSKEDFVKLCHGIPIQNKIEFKKQAELITLVKWFKDSGFLEQESISWAYFKDSCTIKNKSINSDTLRKIAKGTISPNIHADLLNFLPNN